MAGVLVLIGVAVLAVPVLLILALVSVAGLKRRVAVLEQQLDALRRSAAAGAATGVPATEPAPRATAPVPERVRPELQSDVSAPTLAELTRPTTPAHGPEPPAPRATAPVPPPLPPAEVAVPAAASARAPQAPSAPAEPPRPDFISLGLRAVKRWFTVGNVPVKIGVLVLFAGVAALLKYASDQGWLRLPIELRLAGIAAASLAALVFAWRKRESNRSFALSLQGGAIGILLLTVFAAFKRYELLEATPAFALSVILIAGAGALAVLQNAKALAVFAILAGFLAPIWLSTGSGNHVALFSYYAVLNAAILGVAWWKPWRILNLLGFVFTFGIGTAWGVLDYQPAKFATTEPFLLLFFAFYLIIPLLYARRQPEGRRGLVEGCLVFGTPLVAFSLQAGLLQGERLPLAFNALGLAALYALLAAALRRRGGFERMAPSYAVLAVGFATLAVPLALSAHATASVFALEGAALVWLGLHQQRRLPLITGTGLQLLAAFAFLLGLSPVLPDTAVANPAFMGALLIALAGLASAWVLRAHDRPMPALAFYLWGMAWWLGTAINEIGRFVAWDVRADALLVLVAFTGWIAAEVHRRRPATALAMTTLLALAAALPLALAQTQAHGQPFAGYGALAWLAYAAMGVRSLLCLRSSEHALAGWAQFAWLLVWPSVLSMLLEWVGGRFELAEGWRALGIGLPWLVAAALGLFRWPWLAAPLGARFDGYRGTLLVVLFAMLGIGGLGSLWLAGAASPLPWVPLLNPLELAQLAVFVLFACWAWSPQAPELLRQWRPMALALLGFALITSVVLHAVHHWGGVAWNDRLISTGLAQTSLTVVWSVLGVIGWIAGSRRGQRGLWLAGAVLMGVVLVKLILVDRGNLGDVLGIASFIAYGLLCTVVGYLAPAPPRVAGPENDGEHA
ncbi:DUF2339 domain-containing protein [Pseudoxanthomonas sp. z9]|uniref:DUF2339 domain-containing protein n=1 Tax=Pseudoxanthomonas sp. z9 TaxID=2584942 RepID=UPI001143AB73|nr:DUF2339 domain-containing protein [Pseudoxanthomonas sp. z9]